MTETNDPTDTNSDMSALGLTTTSSTLDSTTEKQILQDILDGNDDDDDDDLEALLRTPRSSENQYATSLMSGKRQSSRDEMTNNNNNNNDDAFSSSSSEDEGENTKTPRFSNQRNASKNQYTLKDNDSGKNQTQQQQQQQQNFSWVSSADDDDDDDDDITNQNSNQTIKGEPSLSLRISEDTTDNNTTNNIAKDDNNAFADNNISGKSSNNNKQQQDKLPPQQQQNQQQNQQQSPFDQALHEVKRGGGHSRTNSFTFESPTNIAAAAASASSGASAAAGTPASSAVSSSNLTGSASTSAAVAVAATSDDEDESKTNNDDDDDDDDGDEKTHNKTSANSSFLAKAENLVLDEILDAVSAETQLMEEEELNIFNIAPSAEEVVSPSSSNLPPANKNSTSIGLGGGVDEDKSSSIVNTASKGKTNTTAATAAATASTAGSTAAVSSNPASMMQMIQNTTTATATLQNYYKNEEERESMRRSFQQSISAAVLVSLAHKRYERRRLAAMEIEKVVRSYAMTEDYPRVRAILLLLSDDYVRSTNEDARKGGAVALAACAIGLKKANEGRRDVMECRDLILASVVHACQDHSQRVRYYATESLFNVTKVIPSLAVRHFFILFEILRSLYADVDLDVRSGAELLDKKLKEVIVGAINSGSFSADACVPVFARFVYMRNKATKQLTLTWLQEFSEKLVGAPILSFLHLFLGGIFAMIADPNSTIRTLALDFLQLVLPKLLLSKGNEDFEDAQHQQKLDFDKILQSLVLTMEHPDPFVRKVAMYWMLRIVQAHMSSAFPANNDHKGDKLLAEQGQDLTAASASVRNALPHVLPGILLSIGDTHQSRAKDAFLPDQTTHNLAEQANACLQDAVRRDGKAFIPHLGGFVVALREELDSPGGLIARNPPSVERRPYRMDVKPDGSGIESTGWFRASDGVEERDNALILSRLCALQWVVVLYEHVVPSSLKAEYASEFIDCIIYQLVDQPPGIIVVKSFEVLAKITVPAQGQEHRSIFSALLTSDDDTPESSIPTMNNPMDDECANFALGILEPSRRRLVSRDRSVFAALIDLHSKHEKLLMDVSKVIELMCTLQPPEFIFIAFSTELENFVTSKMQQRKKILESPESDASAIKEELTAFSKDLAFASNFAQQLGLVFFAAPETEQLRREMKDCIAFKGNTLRDEKRACLFHIILHTFSHSIVATLSFCLWGGAFLTASSFLQQIDPLDVSLMFYLELDRLIDLIERPIFRHLHLRLLECDDDPYQEGSGAMLFRTLKSILMVLPQSTSYMILKERLSSTARFRQSAVALHGLSKHVEKGSKTDLFVERLVSTRKLHCDAKWRNIRAESLEDPSRFIGEEQKVMAAQQRREWLGYTDEADEIATKEKMKREMLGNGPRKAEMVGVYEELNEMETPQLGSNKDDNNICETCVDSGDKDKKGQWREYWASHQ